MPTAKQVNNEHNSIIQGLSPNLKSFLGELETYYPDIRFTSGKRNASDKVGKYSSHSHHNTGDAVDLGAEHSDVYSFLLNDKRGLELLNRYNLGVIDETNPETLKQTGGTKIHFHIGTDLKPANYAKERYNNYENIQPLFSYNSDKKAIPIPPIVNEQTGETYQPNQFQIVSGEVDPVYTKLSEDIIKSKITEDKIQSSPERQKIESIRKDRDFLNELFSNRSSEAPQQFDIAQIEMPEIQTELIPLNSIFQTEIPQQQTQ